MDVSSSAIEVAGAFCVAVGLLSCGNDVYALQGGPATSTLAVPARDVFSGVADAMQLHCGTLDCHGQIGRNMRLYGEFGMRLSPVDHPLSRGTTQDEYDACYQSIVGLEPEIMSQVVQLQLPPDALTMVRKPRGIELHKGGKVVVDGDPLDRCIVGWLTGALDPNTCLTVVNTPRPEPDGGP